jgi:hypothetical protein
MLTWLFNNTGGSVLLAMVMHAAFNTAGGFIPLNPAEQTTRSMLVMVLVYWLAVAILVARYGPAQLSLKHAATEEAKW